MLHNELKTHCKMSMMLKSRAVHGVGDIGLVSSGATGTALGGCLNVTQPACLHCASRLPHPGVGSYIPVLVV
jgi:hypothetical protein